MSVVQASVCDEQSTLHCKILETPAKKLQIFDECQLSRETGIIVRGSAFVSLQIVTSCNSTLGAVTQRNFLCRRIDVWMESSFRPVVHARGGALVRRGLGLGLGISFPSYSFHAPLATLLSLLGGRRGHAWVMSRLINWLTCWHNHEWTECPLRHCKNLILLNFLYIPCASTIFRIQSRCSATYWEMW